MEDKEKPADGEEQPGEASEPGGDVTPVGDESGAADAAANTTQAAAEPGAAVTPAAPVVKQAPRGAGRGLGLLALLLAVLALGLSGWMYYQSMNSADDGSAQLQANLERLRGEMGDSAGQIASDNRALQLSLQQEMATLAQEQSAELAALRELVQQQRRRLVDIGSTDRSDWLLAEVEYLLRLANQRMVMAGDSVSALALMGSADEIVRNLDDASLLPLRGAIASDLAALRAVPRVDLEGTWLRIQALVGQVDKLILFELPDNAPEAEPLPEDSSYGDKLAHGFRAALARLSSYVVIRRREQPYEALMDPQWEGLVRQNLRMLLEQSRSALLSGNQRLYSASIDNTRRWLGEFFSFNEAGVAALDAELESLAGLQISPQLPDLTASLAAVKLAIDERHNLASGVQ